VGLIHGLFRGRGGNRSSLDLVATKLWAGRSRFRIPVRARDLSVVHNIHTGSVAHLADAVYTLNPYINDASSFHFTFLVSVQPDGHVGRILSHSLI
jgi:predicted metalloprotease with PDZ domain